MPTHDIPPPGLVSVVVPARNAAGVIGGQLAALERQDHDGPWEVVVVDNGSSDGTADVVSWWRDRLPGLRVLRHERPGVSGARNAGCAVARGELFAFCDTDDVVAPGWLGGLVRAAAGADVVGGPLDVTVLNGPRAQASRLPNPPDRLPVIMGFLPYAVGACMAVRAGVFRELGGFDEEYTGNGGDDVELCLRAQLSGHTIAFAPDAVVHYRLRDRPASLARQQIGYGRADALLLRHFRAHGLRGDRTATATAHWARLLLGLPRALLTGRSGMWVCEAAWRVGRLVGSAEQRTWCP